MQSYIALLRGINISGKNKVAMPQLKTAFKDLGFLRVRTYINSGNVLFCGEDADTGELARRCEAMMRQQFGLDVPVAVLTQDELARALGHAPEWWDAPCETQAIHQVIFLIAPTTVAQVQKAVGEAKPAYEQVAFFENVIFWSAPRATLSRTRWYKIASSPANNKVTIRNASTAKKLLALLKE